MVSRWQQCLAAPHHVAAPQLAAPGTITGTVTVRILRSRLCQTIFSKQLFRLERIAVLPEELHRKLPPSTSLVILNLGTLTRSHTLYLLLLSLRRTGFCPAPTLLHHIRPVFQWSWLIRSLEILFLPPHQVYQQPPA
jgi:hypothetical protein